MESAFRVIVKNSLFNLGGRTLLIVANLVIVPFIVLKIGIANYGIWTILFAFMSTFNLIDLGISSSYARFIAASKEKEGTAGVNVVVTSGLYLNILFGAGFFLFGLSIRDFVILKVLKGADYEFLPEIYTAALAVFALSYVFGIFVSILDGAQRMDLTNYSMVTSKAVELVLIVVLLSRGYMLGGIIAAVVAGKVVLVLSLLVCSRRVIVGLSVAPKYFSWPRLKKILSFGLQMQAINVGKWVNLNLDKFLISFFLGVEMVTYYDLAHKIIGAAKNTCISFISPVMPAASALTDYREHGTIHVLFIRSMKVLIVFSSLVFFGIALTGRQLVPLWLGSPYPETFWTLIILSAGAYLHIMTGIGTSIFRGVNKLAYEVAYSTMYLVMNVILSFVFIVTIGFYGAAAGTSLSSAAASVYFLYSFARYYRMPAARTFSDLFSIPLSACLGMSILFFAADAIIDAHDIVFLTRTSNFLVLSVKISAFASGFLFVLFASGYFGPLGKAKDFFVGAFSRSTARR